MVILSLELYTTVDSPPVFAYSKIPITTPPTRSPSPPKSANTLSAPLVGEGDEVDLLEAEDDGEGCVVEAVDESLPLAFLLLPSKALVATPVRLVHEPGLAEVENVMSAH